MGEPPSSLNLDISVHTFVCHANIRLDRVLDAMNVNAQDRIKRSSYLEASFDSVLGVYIHSI